MDTIHENDCTPGRRLRIGYVSADFREHSASKVFGGMLTHYDRSQFEVYAYSNSRLKEDRYSELFRKNVTVWRNIAGLSDQAAASMLLDDRIDILVDLSGHTAGNRLLVFARRPAPIQITALGYAAGTGMQAMDVFFTDRVMVPLDEVGYYREEVRYLPCALGLFSMDEFPAVNALPALSNGVVTFGSFNRLAKVSNDTYRTWAKLLLAIPGSRLLLKATELDDALNRERILQAFTQAGIAAERIVMRGNTSWYEHMQAYHQVDIALDPFPHGGGVTALEGLMMGVPVITRRWPTLTGRISASVMTTLKLPGWIAETPEQYVEIAVGQANDLQSLSKLRGQLRGIFTSSVLGDQAAFVRSVEQEYRKLWQEWCVISRSDGDLK
jgi:predicted O-linked N-acetylglucosamine transferase (SPINDLY family)